MKKFYISLFLIAVMAISCKENEPVVEPILPVGPIQGITATFSSFTPTSAKVGQTITLTGTNFSTTLSENLVVFTTQNTSVNIAAKSATATTITVDIPTNAITGMIAVKVKGLTAQMATGFNANLTIIP